MRITAPKTWSLRYVILLALLVDLLLPSWIAFEIERDDVNARLTKELTADRDRYADLLSVSLREPLWQLAPQFAEALVDKILEDPKVAHIVVTRMPEGQVFVERGNRLQSGVAPATRPVIVQNLTLGQLTITINDSGVRAATAEAQNRSLWRTGWISVAAILLITLVLHVRLNRPIDRLVRQSEALAASRLDTPFTWARNDELGRLGQSLENTRQALAHLVGELQTVNQELRTENAQRKAAEEKIARHAEVLEDRVAERTTELSSANATLSKTLDDLRQTQADLIESKKLASLGRMVAGIAHELNTPIGNALTIGTSMGERVHELRAIFNEGQMKRATMTEFLDLSEEACTVMERSLVRAASLVTNFKRATESQSNEPLSTFDLAHLTEQVFSEFSTRYPETQIHLVAKVPAGIFMTSYAGLLAQVLSNLLDNARVHAFEHVNEPRITVEVTANGSQVAIVVTDNGAGIPTELHTRIFEPMFTAHLGRGGVGLGLSVTQNIVVRHLGGKIGVQSALVSGACFVIHVPLVAPANAA